MTRHDPASDDEDAPLDPAAEKVRRKLVRFMAINLSILFLALMAVVAAIVYRAVIVPSSDESGAGEPVAAGQPAARETEGQIVLPAGARIVEQTLSGDRLALRVRLEDRRQAIIIYDTVSAATLGRFAIIEGEEP